MNKLKLLLFAVFTIIGWNTAKADVVENYIVNFDTKIEDVSSNHAFKVAAGWRHIVDTYTDWGDENYVTYIWNAASGVDDSGALGVGLGHDTYDLLVTPLVKGNVSISAKRYLDNSSFVPLVEFYKVTLDNGVLKRGEKIATSAYTLASVDDGFETISATVDDWTMIGIRAHAVYLDNFAATQADVQYEKKMAIKTWTSNNPESVVADENGNFTVSYTVTVENNGEAELASGTEGYELIMKTNDNRTVYTLPINQTLAVGETSAPIDFTATVNMSDYPDRLRYNIYNGLDANDWKYGDWIEPISANAMLVVGRSGLTTSLAAGSTINFGPTRQDVVYPMSLKNKGGEELTISEIILPEGFTSNAELPITLATDQTQIVQITMSAANVGDMTGSMIFKGNIDDQTYTLKGKVVAEDVWFTNFEDNQMPADMITEGSNWRTSMNVTEQAYEVNKYYAENYKAEPTKMVTPKMQVEEGDVLTFEAARYSSDDAQINVYYSADRNEWTLVRTVGSNVANEEDKMSEEKVYNSLYANFVFTPFTVNNIPAGEWYIAFEGSNAKIDNIEAYKVAVVEHDLNVSNLNIAAQGAVNTAMNVAATIKNMLAKAETTDDMKVEFHFGNDVVELDPQAIAAGGQAEYSFEYTPHAAGEQEAYLQINIGEYEAKSETKTVNVSEEVASNEQVVGTPNYTGNTGVVDLYYRYSEVETVYTADMLGLSNGTKITRLAYRGYNPTEVATNIQLWIENTTDEAPVATNALPNTENMTLVFDGDYTVAAAGSSSNIVEIMSFNLAEPFVYTGGNLRVVAKKSSSATPNARFQLNQETNTLTKFRRSDNNDLDTKVFQTTYLPILYLGTERQPATVTGTVTAQDGGNAIEGASVTFKSGNVEYSATTDAEGKYEAVVMQDGLTYTLNIVKAGYAPFKQENVNVAETTVYDAQLAAANEIVIDEFEIEEKGSVNAEMKATAVVMNPLVEDVAAGSYTAELYFGEEKVADAKAVAIASEKTGKLRFNFYPHKAGEFSAKVRLVRGENTIESEAKSVVIEEEKGEKIIQVGDIVNINDSKSFGNFYYNKSEMQTIYTSDILNLPAGAKINSISIKGYSPAAKTLNTYQSLFLENTEEALVSTAAVRDTLEMTKVYAANKTYELTAGNSSSYDVMFTFEFDEPFVYTGQNLRLAFHTDANTYQRIYFESDNGKTSIVRYNDNNLANATWEETGMAVAYMSVTMGSPVEGTVVAFSDQSPIANAEVTVKSGGIEYYGETDAEGKYSVNVLKTDLSYDVIVKAEGYADDVQPVSFTGEDIVLTHQMKHEYTLSGVVTDAMSEEAVGEVAVKLMAGDDVAAEAMTDAEGKYEFKLLEPIAENYTLTAEKEGYDMFSESIALSEQATEKNIVMTRLVYTLTGVVTDEETNEPIANVQLAIDDIVTNTDGEGKYEFTLTWPVEESYTVSATAEGYQDVTFDVAIAELLTVKDFTMLRLRNVVSGTVIATDGQAIEGVAITLTKGDETLQATTDAEGKYEITVVNAEGEYSFTAAKEGYADFNTTVTFSGEDLTQDVTLQTNEELSVGRINGEGTQFRATSDGIVVESANGATINIYNYAGQLVRSERVAAGTVKIELPQGLYVVNGIKLTVK